MWCELFHLPQFTKYYLVRNSDENKGLSIFLVEWEKIKKIAFSKKSISSKIFCCSCRLCFLQLYHTNYTLFSYTLVQTNSTVLSKFGQSGLRKTKEIRTEKRAGQWEQLQYELWRCLVGTKCQILTIIRVELTK